MALAEKGDNLKLDVTMKDVAAEGESKDEGGDMYSKISDFIPRPVMLWGKAAGGKLGKLALFCAHMWFKKEARTIGSIAVLVQGPRKVKSFGKVTDTLSL